MSTLLKLLCVVWLLLAGVGILLVVGPGDTLHRRLHKSFPWQSEMCWCEACEVISPWRAGHRRIAMIGVGALFASCFIAGITGGAAWSLHAQKRRQARRSVIQPAEGLD